MEDDFGSGIREYDLENVNIKDSLTRYFRSILETEPTDERPNILFRKLQKYYDYGKGIPLRDIIAVISEEISNKDKFINDWIELLKSHTGKFSDYYLREAIILKDGAEGIKSLALSEGGKRPRAYLDWIKELIKSEDFESVISASQEAFRVLDKGLPISSTISDFVKIAAERIGDSNLVEKSIWGSFYAKPDQDHLLELWKYFREKDIDIMTRASERIKEYLESKDFTVSEDSVEKDNAEDYVHGSKLTLAHAYLLSKAWDSSLTLAKKEKEYGWSYSDNSQGLIVLSFLAMMIGEPIDKLPSNLKYLFENFLENKSSLSYGKEKYSEIKKVYSEYIPTISLGEKEEAILDWCITICEKRVNYIVSNKHRRSYEKAARLIAASLEVLKAKGKIEEAAKLAGQIKNQFPRHRAFQDELKRSLSR